jgi:nitrogen fixation protein NifU and related proteins
MPLSADQVAVTPAAGGATAPDIGVAALYQEIILSHYRSPRHKGVLPSASATIEHRNPLCGDVLSLQLQFDGDRIADAAFDARACSITQATASMLLSALIGGTVVSARHTLGEVELLLESGMPDNEPAAALGDLRALASVSRFPARKACVRLVTGAVAEALASR